jgi:hypothetical protein
VASIFGVSCRKAEATHVIDIGLIVDTAIPFLVPYMFSKTAEFFVIWFSIYKLIVDTTMPYLKRLNIEVNFVFKSLTLSLFF